MFEVNSKVVYPAHGVMRVKSVVKRIIDRQTKQFYVLGGLSNLMTIMVPTENPEKFGIRNLVTQEEAETILERFETEKPKIITETWNRRYRLFLEQIKSGDLNEVATVYLTLLYIRDEKDLSFGERKVMDNAKNLLVEELSLALSQTPSEVEAELEKRFLDSPE